MWNRVLRACGIAMPAIYGLMLTTSCSLNPGFNPLRHDPSELGVADAAYPLVYDAGMVATALAGLLAGGALLVIAGARRGAAWAFCAGATVLLSSVGLAMAGLFPLPSPLHYGFGLTTAAILTPLFGAASLRRMGRRSAAAVLLVALVLIAGLVAGGAPPLLPGGLMLAVIAVLCWTHAAAVLACEGQTCDTKASS